MAELRPFNLAGAFQGAQQNALTSQLQQEQLSRVRTGAQREQQAFEQSDISRRARLVNQSAKALLNLPAQQRQQAYQQLKPRLNQLGVDTSPFDGVQFTDEALNNAIASTQGVISDPKGFERDLKTRTLDVRERELEQRGELLREQPRRKGEEEKFKLEAQRGLKAEVEEEVAAGKARGKKAEERGQEIITKGLAAADSTATIRRGMQLLEGIETGGVDRVRLGAKQLFGVESADEGELSNLLGKAVMAQLRETFGAAFTAKEGESLRAIDANIGKSPAANRRVLRNALRIAERAAQRGIDRAVEAKDFRTAGEIQGALDFVLEELEGAEQPADDAQPQQGGTFTSSGGIEFTVE